MANINLEKYGITGTTEIVHNPSFETLFEEETRADLTGYEAGTHNIDVYVKNDLNLAVMQAKPITITVTIK